MFMIQFYRSGNMNILFVTFFQNPRLPPFNGGKATRYSKRYANRWYLGVTWPNLYPCTSVERCARNQIADRGAAAD